jgi:glycosyltransferase involved in cell wall biosynthesis
MGLGRPALEGLVAPTAGVKVLVVLASPPLPEGGAPGRCAVGLLRGLATHGVQVSALAARRAFNVPGEPPPDLPVEVMPLPAEAERPLGRLARLRRPRSDLSLGAFGARVREAARTSDVVHLEEIETAWCNEGVATPAALHLHFLVLRDRSLGWPGRRDVRDTIELWLAERAALRRHRHLVASSPVVAQRLRASAPAADIVLAPLSLDPDLYRPASLDGPPTAGIIGTAAWPPTREAVGRLVERVWPLVTRALPEARLLVAGRGMRELGSILSRPGVEVVGEVPSAPDFLRRLSLLLFPLERGSGMKVKVLEAIASGVPVVTTAAGVEGIEAGAGTVVESEDARLAAAAVELLRDPAARRERGAAARAAFELRYAPAPATAPLVRLYERLSGGTR